VNPITIIDNYLNRITMYRLMAYGLGILLAAAAVLGFTGTITQSGAAIIVTSLMLAVGCYIANRIFGWLFGVATNSESAIITGLIIACIVPPSTDGERLFYIALAGGVAIASKYLIAWRHKHIFNPAALGVTVLSVAGLLPAVWWVGGPSLLPLVALLSLLVWRKVRRFTLVTVFFIAAVEMLVIVAAAGHRDVGDAVRNAVMSGPIVFFAGIMLTEPATMPGRKYYQLLYALLVGVLYPAALHWGVLSTSPHMVLLAGNLFAFLITPIYQARLKLKEKNQISEHVYDYVFTADHPLRATPGQYMEWTLPHHHVDGRGNRRTFTIASSPTEDTVHLGVKFYDPPSSFKKTLFALQPGDTIIAGRPAGSFTLPDNPDQKLAFVAGGIGITPFRSMIKYLADTNQTRDILLFYLVGDPHELAYMGIFKAAEAVGVKTIPLTGGTPLTAELLHDADPHFTERTFYLSGPSGLVNAYKKLLHSQGLGYGKVVTDYFFGY
jgi:glycine betaine catabolism B